MANQTPRTRAQQPRVIRVFISSTFRDMQEEREELVKRIFPQLRKLCEARRVTWGEVDLRWGIPDEQKAEGKVLPTCLAEIHHCRPYFIGFLGERYGWVPDEIPAELIEREPWLAEHRTRSVTELEILHGALNNPDMADHAFFYFRSPSYNEALPPEQQEIYREEPTAADRKQKLTALKERIRTSGYAVREAYPDPRAVGELVLQDLTDVIDRLYPWESIPDPLDREAAEHEAFAESRARVYIRREENFKRLDGHVQGYHPPLVVLGESGMGKSALLANWALDYRTKYPDDLLIMHFIGASQYSSDWMAMLRRIMGEFKRRFGIQQDIPEQPDALRHAFANWLHMAAAQGNVVLILDALNQLEDRDQAPDLAWLSPEIPANVRLILSTLPGRSFDALSTRAWPTMQVEPLRVEERKEIIAAYLAQSSKTLTPQHVESIAAADPTANPLYLRALLEELRLFGVHERLEEHIGHYLAAPTAETLYTKILERYEQDYERDRPGLVQEAMSLLWAARRGLSEAELLDLLGSKAESSKASRWWSKLWPKSKAKQTRTDIPLPHAYWSPLFLAAEHALVSRSGLIGFGHDYLRQAVQERYVRTNKAQQAVHIRLGHYFSAQALGPRKVDELPWQLVRAQSWEWLNDVLANLEFFVYAWKVNVDLGPFWAQVESNSPFRIVEAYRVVRVSPENHDLDSLRAVALVFRYIGHPIESSSLLAHLIERHRQAGDRVNLAADLHIQAQILFDCGQLGNALLLLQEEESLCRELSSAYGLSCSLGSQARILYVRGYLNQALALHKEEERIFRDSGHKFNLATSIGSQALIYKDLGDLDRAIQLHKSEERLLQDLGASRSLAISLGNQALIWESQGDLNAAQTLNREQERICRELGDKMGLATCLGVQALIFKGYGDLGKAMELHKKEETLCRDLEYNYGLGTSLSNQALIWESWGDLDTALTLLREQERLCRKLGNADGLWRSLYNQARLLIKENDYSSALLKCDEAVDILRKTRIEPNSLNLAEHMLAHIRANV